MPGTLIRRLKTLLPSRQRKAKAGDVNMDRFEQRVPSHHNAVDIFRGSWASNLDGLLPNADTGGDAPSFHSEFRTDFAARTLGRNGRFDGMSMLELGPLEGGQTFTLENLGADILAIEANRDAYLKCLITKEIAGNRRTRFLLGDFIEYLKTTQDRHDVVFACGVLYHLSDPLTAIELFCKVSDRCYVWTHYYDANNYSGPPRQLIRDPRAPEFELWLHDYGRAMNHAKFWGGNRRQNIWMRREDILAAFRRQGMTIVEVAEMPSTNGLPSISFSAIRKAKAPEA